MIRMISWALAALFFAGSAQAQVCLDNSRTLLGMGRKADVNMRAAQYDGTSDGFLPVFTTGEGWGEDNYTTDVAFGDVDGDGVDEFGVARKTDENERFFIYDDAGNFNLPLFSGGSGWGSDNYATGIAFGDFDGDDIDEVAISRNSGENDRVFVYKRDQLNDWFLIYSTGDGWGSGNYATAVAFGNVDGDAAEELAIARNAEDNFRVRVIDDLGAGADSLGDFGNGWGSGNYATGVAFGDIDGDNIDELAISRRSDENERVFVLDLVAGVWNTIYTAGDGWGSDNYATSVAFGDVDNDGIDELAFSRKTDTNYRVAVIDDAGAGFASLFTTGDGWGDDNYATDVALGDSNGDGVAELAIARRSDENDRVSVWRRDTANNWQTVWRDGSGWGSDNYATAVAFSSRPANGADSDGDGLLDDWETQGIDVDCDGTADVDLPNMGADPNHKDLYLEVDWWSAAHAPSQKDVWQMKAAFMAAPANAGGIANPDGRSGIRLWIDTGTLIDPGGIEGGASCTDGVDNDSDGQSDEIDPDCTSAYGREGVGFCGDGVDNDGDGNSDSSDADCLGGGVIEGGGFCNDGVDNDGDATIDGADPNCLVGDNFAVFQNAGQIPAAFVPARGIPHLDDSFYTAKRASFNLNRNFAFRYAIMGPGFDPTRTEAGGGSCDDSVDNDGDGDTDCDDSNCRCYGGGWGELGGNDFVEYNHDPGTLMHELGHTLNLGHGGQQPDGSRDSWNCKPNYVSVMNYDHQRRIRRNPNSGQTQDIDGDGLDDNRILDFSPPRFPGGRSTAPLVPLVQNALVETTVFDTTDPANQFMFVDSSGAKTRWPLQGRDLNGDGIIDGTDWSGDGALTAGSLTVDIDIADATSGNPDACNDNAGTPSTVMNGRNDWAVVALAFRQFGDSLDAPINPAQERDPGRQELEEFESDLNTTNLAIRIDATPSPVAVGDLLTLSVQVENLGPHQADGMQVEFHLPSGTTHLSDTGACTAVSPGHLVCEIGDMFDGFTTDFDVELAVGLNTTGGARTIEAAVVHRAGPDVDMVDNFDSLVLVQKPSWAGFEDESRPWSATDPARIGSSDHATEGERSLAISGCGWLPVSSPAFATTEFEEIGDTLAVDVFLPQNQSNPWWIGDIAATFDAPSAGVYGEWLGYASLGDLPRGTWSTLTFPVTPHAREALLGDFPRAQIVLSVNLGSCAEPLLIDNLRFVDDLEFRSEFHSVGSEDLAVISSGVMTFDTADDWSAPQGPTILDTSHVSQGTASIAVDASGWWAIESRPFSTTELTGVTSRLNLDLFVPDPQPNKWWVGETQLYVSCPSAGIYNQYLGQHSLNHLFFGEFNALSYNLPQHVTNALSGDEECSVTVALTVASGAGRFQLDNMGFIQ